MTRKVLALALFCAFAAFPAQAGGVNVALTDSDGNPAANAVVELIRDGTGDLPPSHVSGEAVIDQRHETFIPLVSVIRKGGHVVFTNHDTTMHQVYSFSPIKQFEFEMDQGQRSDPVVFDKPGVASIGCNIHDQMITYVYVADSPFAARTDAQGRVAFADVPAGAYHVHVWHPNLVPGRSAPSPALAVGTGASNIAAQVALMAPPSMKHMHMGAY